MPSSNPDSWEGRLRGELRDLESGLPSTPRYERRGMLGHGGMGTVVRAWDRLLKRDVALKVIDREQPTGVEILRFRRETEIAARLSHPNVVSVFDAGEEDGRMFLVMELVEGPSLGALLRDGKTGLPGLLGILEQAARGVAAAHELGIVHRDLKPDNILIASGDRAKVADFGLAHWLREETGLTQPGTILGTPDYMPPEQASGSLDQITAASDVYALGAILYRILTGRPPHVADTVLKLVERIVTQDPPSPRTLRPDVAGDIETVCLKALAREPSQRYAKASDFADEIARFLAGQAILAKPAGTLDRIRRKIRRHKVRIAVAAVVLVIFAGLAISAIRAQRSSDAFHTSYHAGMHAWDRAARLMQDGAAATEWTGKAAAHFESAAVAAPGRPEAWLMIGRCRSLLGDPAAAERALSEAVLRDAGNGPARFERGRFYLGRHLKIRPPPLIWVSGGRVRVGRRPAETEDEKGWRMKGEADLREARGRGGLARGEIAYLEGVAALGEERYADALPRLAEYVEACPWDAGATALLGSVSFLSGDFAAAEKSTGRAIGMQDRPEWRKARAAARACQGNLKGALEDLEKIDGDDAEVICDRGTVLAGLDRGPEAEACFTRALEIRPTFARACNNRGIVRIGRRDFEGAEKDFRKASFHDPLYAEAGNNLGNVLLLSGRLDEALDEFDAAIELDRDYAAAYVNRAKARRMKGLNDEALQDLRRALAIDGSDTIRKLIEDWSKKP